MTTFAAIGLDHRHIYHLIAELLAAGARCAGYWTGTSDPKVLQGVRERFPALRAVDERELLLDDPAVDLIVSAAVPSQRAALAIEAMRRGKDVLLDKPGVTDFEQLEQVRSTVQQTGRIFSICFSERHIVPAVEVARRMVDDGAIGEVVQTVGLGPHRLNRAIRPDWFFDRRAFGGILVDIASHQIDQFLVFTRSADAQVMHAAVAHHGQDTAADFQDFGEIVLRSRPGGQHGYIRVDWFTPDGLPTWGDGRLFILGTRGSIEIRKYLDIEGRDGGNHLFVADHRGTRHVDCSAEPLSFFRDLLGDLRERTHNAMSQEHVFTVCRLVLEANARALEPGAAQAARGLETSAGPAPRSGALA